MHNYNFIIPSQLLLFNIFVIDFFYFIKMLRFAYTLFKFSILHLNI